jgi:hypothetical protein
LHCHIQYDLTTSVQYIALCAPLEATAGSSLSELAADLLLVKNRMNEKAESLLQFLCIVYIGLCFQKYC